MHNYPKLNLKTKVVKNVWLWTCMVTCSLSSQVGKDTEKFGKTVLKHQWKDQLLSSCLFL